MSKISFDTIISYAAGDHNWMVFDQISDQIKKNNVVPFVGAGLTCSFYPLWTSALNKMALSINNDEVRASVMNCIEKDTIKAAQELEDKLGKRKLQNLIKDIFSIGKYTDRKHEVTGMAVGLLPYLFPDSPMITTNFDQVLETLYADRGISFGDIVLPTNTVILSQMFQGSGHGLFHLHGKVSGNMIDYNDIVFTQRQYDERYSEGSPLVSQLKRWYQGRMMLFLGCSLNADMTLKILKTVSSPGVEHFAIVECEKEKIDERLRILGDDYGINAIVYPKGEHDSVRIILERLLSYTNPDRYRFFLGTLPDNTSSTNKKNLARFRYDANNIGFFGREEEIIKLKLFCNCNTLNLRKDNDFCWWAVTGPGGSGKSRLVYEIGEELKKTCQWHVKKLVSNDYKNLSLVSRQFQGNTLILADYAGGHLEELGNWIEELSNESRWPGHIRLLLIERDEKLEGFPFWYSTLVDHIGMDKYLFGAQKYKEDILRLSVLDEFDLKSIMNSYAEFQGYNNLDIDFLYHILERIDPDLCRPLYAIFIVDSVCHGYDPFHLTIDDVLTNVIEREQKIYHDYIGSINGGKQSKKLNKIVDRIRGIATIYEDIHIDDLTDHYSDLWVSLKNLINDLDSLDSCVYSPEDFLKYCNILNDDGYIEAIRPDILGEYYVLQTQNDTNNMEDIFSPGWTERINQLMPFFVRLISDYGLRLNDNFWKMLMDIDINLIDQFSCLTFSKVLLACTLDESRIDISQKAVDIIRNLHEKYDNLDRIFAASLYNQINNLKLEDGEPLLYELRMLYSSKNDLEVRQFLAMSLANRIGIVNPDKGKQLLNELRLLYQVNINNNDIRRLLASGLLNQFTNVGIYKGEPFLQELRDLHKEYPDDQEVREILAIGLSNLSNLEPMQRENILEELRILNRENAADTKVREIFMHELVNLIDEVGSEKGNALLQDLIMLYKENPEDVMVCEYYAAGLFGHYNNLEFENGELVFEELNDLYEKKSEDIEILKFFSKVLVNQIGQISPEKGAILLGKLRDLYSANTEDNVMREIYATGLLAHYNSLDDPDGRKRVIEDLRFLYIRNSKDIEVGLIFAQALSNEIGQTDPKNGEELLNELRELHNNHPENEEVGLIFATGLFNQLNNIDAKEGDLLFEELIALYKDI